VHILRGEKWNPLNRQGLISYAQWIRNPKWWRMYVTAGYCVANKEAEALNRED